MPLIDSVKNIFKWDKKPDDTAKELEEFLDSKQDFESEEEIVDYVRKEFERRQQERLPFELQWRLNINFLEGNQYLDINPVTQSLEEVAKLYWFQERTVYNHVAPIMETRLAKLSRLTPILKTRPSTKDRDDVSSAKVTNKVLENLTHEQEMREKQLDKNNWSEITGTVLTKSIWDETLGEELFDGLAEGDVQPIICSPFEIYPDSCFSANLEDCESIIHAKAFPVEEIMKVWKKNVTGSDINVFTLKEHDNVMGSLGSRQGAFSVASQKKKDHAVVYEYWERPTVKYPEGRLIISTNDTLLLISELPYNVGKNGRKDLPFAMQRSIVVSNCFWGKSIIQRLIPIQRDFNALKNRMKEYLNRAAIGQLVYEEGSIDEAWLEDEGLAPGAMIPYRPGSRPPHYMESPPLPAEFRMEEQNLMHQFVVISGVSEISRDSSAPTGVNSGIALSILQEQDDTRLALTAKNMDNAIIQNAKIWIRLYKQFADIPRIIRSVGKDNEVEVTEWFGSMLTSDDIYIETGTQLSESPAQRRQMVFDLIQSGIFLDPDTGRMSKAGRAKIFEMLQMGNWENFDTETELQIAKARRENAVMTEGAMPPVVDFDDDTVHIETHNLYRLSADYEDQVKDNPQLEEMFGQHVMMHTEQLMAKVQPSPEQAGMEANMQPEQAMQIPEGGVM